VLGHGQGVAAEKGQHEAVPLRVAYTAHEGCPDADAFLARVLERAKVARAAEPGEVAHTLVVNIVRDGDASSGTLSRVDRDGTTSTRDVAAPSCEHVVTALALVASVCIEQEITHAESEAPSTAAAAGGEREGESDAAEMDADGSGETGPVVAEASVQPAPFVPTSDRVAVGASVALTTTYDELTMEPRVFGQLGLDADLLPDAAVRFGFAVAGNSATAMRGEAHFTWETMRLELCPLGVRAFSFAVVRPCAGVEGGVSSSKVDYRPEDDDTKRHASHQRVWAATVVLLRTEVRAVGPVWIEAEVGLAAPLIRDEYFFEFAGREGETARAMPPVGVFGAIGVGAGWK
jgi:hypothetical protein